MKNKVKVITKIDETDKEFEGRVNLFLAENLHAHIDAKLDDDMVVIKYEDLELDPDPRWT